MADTSKKTFNPEKDLQDLTGKVAFVTGGNRGIGYHTVRHLSRKGATVYLGSRSEEAGRAAVEKLNKELESLEDCKGKVVNAWCDISTPQKARRTAEGMLEKVSRLDILVLNAAMLADWSIKVPSDILATNHFGNYALIRSLLPKLNETAEKYGEARLISVSSDAHKMSQANNPNIDFSSESSFREDYSKLFSGFFGSSVKTFRTAFSYYCISKLCQVLTNLSLVSPSTSDLDSTFPSAHPNLISILADPGAVNTFSGRSFITRLLEPIINRFFDSPEVGSYNLLFAAASSQITREKEKYHGKFLNPVGRITEMGSNVTLERARKMVKTTEEMLAKVDEGEEVFPLVK